MLYIYNNYINIYNIYIFIILFIIIYFEIELINILKQ